MHCHPQSGVYGELKQAGLLDNEKLTGETIETLWRQYKKYPPREIQTRETQTGDNDIIGRAYLQTQRTQTLPPQSFFYTFLYAILSFLCVSEARRFRWESFPGVLSWYTTLLYHGGHKVINLVRGVGFLHWVAGNFQPNALSFNIPAPNTSTITRFYDSMQLPGFYTEVLQDLRLVCKGETRFLLQVDETDLKEQVVVCHRLHKVFGLTCIYDLLYFIQHYTQLLQEKNKANKVLVFLLIPLNFTFKIPVAFCFTRTASGDEL